MATMGRQPPTVLLMGGCGTGKSTVFEKLVMEESGGHSSASSTSQTSVWLASESPDGRVVVIDTPGQDVLTDQVANNQQIAVALRYPAGISLILVTAKAQPRLEAIKSQVEDYIEQLSDCDCSGIICVAVTHMDSQDIKWSKDDVKRMLRRQFGLRAAVFSGFDQDREDLLQQVLSCASREPLNLTEASDAFQEMFTISDDKMRALKSIHELVAVFEGRSTRLVALAKKNASSLGQDGLAQLVFEFKKNVALEIDEANVILKEANGWRLDGEARERYEQAGYLAYFKQAVHQKLESAVGTIEGLRTAQPHLVRACPHCGCAQLASAAFAGTFTWRYSSSFSSFTCGGQSNRYENQKHERQRERFRIPFKFFDAASKLEDVDFIPPAKVSESRGCGNWISWNDMKHVQLPHEKVQELEKEAIRSLEAQARRFRPRRDKYAFSWSRFWGGDDSDDDSEDWQPKSTFGSVPLKAKDNTKVVIKDDTKCGARETVSNSCVDNEGRHPILAGGAALDGRYCRAGYAHQVVNRDDAMNGGVALVHRQQPSQRTDTRDTVTPARVHGAATAVIKDDDAERGAVVESDAKSAVKDEVQPSRQTLSSRDTATGSATTAATGTVPAATSTVATPSGEQVDQEAKAVVASSSGALDCSSLRTKAKEGLSGAVLDGTLGSTFGRLQASECPGHLSQPTAATAQVSDAVATAAVPEVNHRYQPYGHDEPQAPQGSLARKPAAAGAATATFPDAVGPTTASEANHRHDEPRSPQGSLASKPAAATAKAPDAVDLAIAAVVEHTRTQHIRLGNAEHDVPQESHPTLTNTVPAAVAPAATFEVDRRFIGAAGLYPPPESSKLNPTFQATAKIALQPLGSGLKSHDHTENLSQRDKDRMCPFAW